MASPLVRLSLWILLYIGKEVTNQNKPGTRLPDGRDRIILDAMSSINDNIRQPYRNLLDTLLPCNRCQNINDEMRVANKVG